MSIITGSYNEYGYVIRKNGYVVYAAGNDPYDSQNYIGSKECKHGSPALSPITEDMNVLPLEEVEDYCKQGAEEACEHPGWYNLKGEHSLGKVSYSKNLNPLEAAYRCGALARS